MQAASRTVPLAVINLRRDDMRILCPQGEEIQVLIGTKGAGPERDQWKLSIILRMLLMKEEVDPLRHGFGESKLYDFLRVAVRDQNADDGSFLPKNGG